MLKTIILVFFLLSFSLDEKETKNQGKKKLPRAAQRWPAFLPAQRSVLTEFILNNETSICKIYEAISLYKFSKVERKKIIALFEGRLITIFSA